MFNVTANLKQCLESLLANWCKIAHAEEYQLVAQKDKDYGYLLRNGYMFKRMLVEVVTHFMAH